ncbi:UDP-N-acetylglucosamine transporter YEA4 [Verticillium alfalfae VaMs.102]|uniref:UDP-N-acetylglucosamine transporter YEA4 n=1 Tax=Verticillium alfalfae (strain VaMs.102 / ATCC MYA-4576 / FGSC 10136) TaxID=526221 RepID=C9SJX1_VERA1|nr:UDP-N-acetylglucosamine transporter YEA4 [Verticillium alfalfae VaMs.102]EEY18989.1 UDP-N-acetylglucosamine transporter YEA4 [Verticillium alfalfae VaMs.102]
MTASSTSRRRGPPRGTHETPVTEKAQSTTRQTGAMQPLNTVNETADTDHIDYEKQHGERDMQALSQGPATLARRLAVDALPQWLAIGVMLGLIFGGCCSNVYALEAIIKVEPSSGTLLTFVQFLFVAVTGYISQLDRSRPPLFIRPNKVPLRRWMVNILLFFSINVLNNHAFSYDISVPVHIILRSGGSITTMGAGSLYGKRYSRIQIVAVLLLTIGVITAAWSDSQTKVTIHPRPTSDVACITVVNDFLPPIEHYRTN